MKLGLLVLILFKWMANAAGQEHPDAGLNTLQIIKRHGFPVERHSVVTEDGYVIELHRIPHGRFNKNSTNKVPVLLMHGLLASATYWINNDGPENSLGLLLADQGYDVWMPNARGTNWSRKHVSLDPDKNKPEFWSFSWHEIGVYDLPSSIDYITNKTVYDSIIYIGHSQGTTTSYVMLSERPEYNRKIKLLISLAPAAYMGNCSNPIMASFSQFAEPLELLGRMVGVYEFIPRTDLVEFMGRSFCSDSTILTQPFCKETIFLILGKSTLIKTELLPVYLTNFPAGASTRQLIHYEQGIKSGKFRKYDHGAKTNQEIYGSKEPPNYSLENITAPVALYYSKDDTLTSWKDVAILLKALPNIAVSHKMDVEGWSHIDFVWARNVRESLYDQMLDVMEKYK